MKSLRDAEKDLQIVSRKGEDSVLFAAHLTGCDDPALMRLVKAYSLDDAGPAHAYLMLAPVSVWEGMAALLGSYDHNGEGKRRLLLGDPRIGPRVELGGVDITTVRGLWSGDGEGPYASVSTLVESCRILESL
jgi:hypothetical protein